MVGFVLGLVSMVKGRLLLICCDRVSVKFCVVGGSVDCVKSVLLCVRLILV